MSIPALLFLIHGPEIAHDQMLLQRAPVDIGLIKPSQQKTHNMSHPRLIEARDFKRVLSLGQK